MSYFFTFSHSSVFFLCFFTLVLKLTFAGSNSSFSFKKFGQDSRFDSVVSLYGDVKALDDGECLQLSGDGRVSVKRPILVYGGNSKKTVSFSSFFEFSVKPDLRNGGGFAFVVFKDEEFKFLSVEFDTLMEHVEIKTSKFGVSFKEKNLSSVSLGLKSGNRLQVWIDYEAGSRRLEVRVNKFGEKRPVDPLLWEEVDLFKIWPESEAFYVGLSSSNGNGNSSQLCNVYSWSFKTRRAPDWMHSEPLDPVGIKKGKVNEIKVEKKDDDCVIRIVSALILGIGLGALGSFVGMFLWMLFARRRPISPEDYAMKPVVDEKSFSK